MYYEERLINGVTYFRHTPNGKWIDKVIDKGVHAGSMAIPVKNCLIADVGGSLPSNGEIEAYAMYQCGGCSPESCDERAGIITGAKWMRQKLIKLLKQ